jgi:hypothetical protein
LFFERFRDALARLPAGLIRPGPLGDPALIAATETALGTKLPATFVSFLSSFDGADLFHEAVIVAGAGEAAPRRLVDLNPATPAADGSPASDGPNGRVDPLVFAETLGGDRYGFDTAGRIVRIRLGSDERWIAGSDFLPWLDGIIAHEKVLYGSDGEFLPDVFEADGTEVVPLTALRQAERALRFCPDSADWHHERGRALRRLERVADARAAFARAAALDPENPWPQFDLGRAALAMGPGAAREAGAAFEAAARLDRGEASARLWVWAGRAALLAADPERLVVCRRQALEKDPGLAASLRRASDDARQSGEAQEIAEAEALLEALEGEVPRGRTRLPVVGGRPAGARGARDGDDASRSGGISDAAARPARRTPRPDPHRPGRATRPRSAAPRRGPRR